MKDDKYTRESKIFSKHFEILVKSLKKEKLRDGDVISSIITSGLVSAIVSFDDTEKFGLYLKEQLMIADQIVSRLREEQEP